MLSRVMRPVRDFWGNPVYLKDGYMVTVDRSLNPVLTILSPVEAFDLFHEDYTINNE